MANPSPKEEFYVGYLPKMSDSFRGRIRWFVIGLIIVFPIIAGLIVTNQAGFATSTFELGKLTEIEGVLVKKPVPFLRISHGVDVHGEPIYQHIMLISFGKFGAEPSIAAMETLHDQDLDGKRLTLRGTLIYHNGKTLLELSEKEKALVKVGESVVKMTEWEDMGEVSLTGEITDPKCYFGVMKPGYGKPHRSCAVRCLSGGIPPVYRSDANSQHPYVIVLGQNGEKINHKLLAEIGAPTQICGQLKRFGDWEILYLDEGKGVTRVGARNGIAECGN